MNSATNNLPVLRLGFIGESGVGKTTLLASCYGYLNSSQFFQEHGYMLKASEQSGEDLGALFDNMKTTKKFPPPTKLEYNKYKFGFIIRGSDTPIFTVEWIDYPGGWWSDELTDPVETQRRDECLISLLQAEVIFLLMDGNLYLNQRDKYIREMLCKFTVKLELLNKEAEKRRLPCRNIDEFVIALSKIDLIDKSTGNDPQHMLSAMRFQKELNEMASPELDALWASIDAKYVKPRYLLFSSVLQGESDQIGNIYRPQGLDLIAPLAVRAECDRLSRRLQQQIPGMSNGKTADVVAASSAVSSSGLLGIAAGQVSGPAAAALGMGTTGAATTGTVTATGTAAAATGTAAAATGTATAATGTAAAAAGTATATAGGASTAAGSVTVTAVTAKVTTAAKAVVAAVTANPIVAFLLGGALLTCSALWAGSKLLGEHQRDKREAANNKIQLLEYGLKLLNAELDRAQAKRLFFQT